jgi:hypothetical protein
MTLGFIPDHAHGATKVSNWVEGGPDKSILFGVKLWRRRKIEIETWRCGKCGYLESYAKG